MLTLYKSGCYTFLRIRGECFKTNLSRRSKYFCKNAKAWKLLQDCNQSDVTKKTRSSLHKIVSDGIRSVIGRKRKPSDPSDYDSVALRIPLTAPFFDLHTIGRLQGVNQP